MRLAPTIALAALFAASGRDATAWTFEPPADHGRVVLGQRSRNAGMDPVQFDHWRHRARHTCRVCHVDVGFAMTVKGSGITAETNRSGFHCGACHDGKGAFASCGERPAAGAPSTCARCHASGDPERRRKDYEALAEGLPRRGTLGAIDWEAAEAAGKVRPSDRVEGLSIERPPLKMDKDVTIPSRAWMTDVKFSHLKHAVWNGCEVCHPDIFPNRAGERRTTMLEISSGASCGACHRRVAFPLGECEGCHRNPVK